MNKQIKVSANGQSIGHLYQKQDGTHTAFSNNDIIAINLVAVLSGATVLGLLA